MNLMDWDATKFDIHVPKMNSQHQKLVGIMNRLYDRHHAKAPKAELDKIVLELRDYTVLHFREEEALLDKLEFPQRQVHKSIHQKLLEDFGTHYQAFAATGLLSEKFFDFLRLWLTSHILHIDRKYGDYAQQQHVA